MGAVLRRGGGGGSIVASISNNLVYRGTSSFGAVAAIRGDLIYPGDGGGFNTVLGHVSGDHICSGSGGFGNVIATISGEFIYNGSGTMPPAAFQVEGSASNLEKAALYLGATRG